MDRETVLAGESLVGLRCQRCREPILLEQEVELEADAATGEITAVRHATMCDKEESE